MASIKLFFIALASFLSVHFFSFSQVDSLNKHKLKKFVIAEASVYAATIVGLNAAWYGNKREAFHFFDDSKEWLQVDKMGHLYTAYHLSRASEKGFLWAGLSAKKSAIYGAVSGFGFMTTIEVLDAFQSEYGFSVSDLTANTLGCGVFLGQNLLWKEQRIKPKWSYHSTGFAKLFPNKLGDNWTNQWLKDYNGQSYWLTFEMSKFLKKDTKVFKWVNLSIGYGAQNMVNADPVKSKQAGFEPYRQYYLALDLNFNSIKTSSKTIKTIFYILDQIKIPAPTLEYNSEKGLLFHPLYF
ncbi:MAG: DUF2279 domain-containing protein [Pseudarcicella sp.]|nr:DUF2279 domain-containing protein [Pseudarcicella sp.]